MKRSFLQFILLGLWLMVTGCTPVQRGLLVGDSKLTAVYDQYNEWCLKDMQKYNFTVIHDNIKETFCQCWSQKIMFAEEDNDKTGHHATWDDWYDVAKQCMKFAERIGPQTVFGPDSWHTGDKL